MRAGLAISVVHLIGFSGAIAVLTACTADNPNYTTNALSCSAGERNCVGERPVVCDVGDGGAMLRNAPCSSAALCDQGRCLPPRNATACLVDGDCAQGACAAFVDPAGLRLKTFCAPAEGNSPGSAACKTDSECRSGLCLRSGTQAMGGLCFLSCQSNRDCDLLSVCRAFDVTVTGIRGTLRACAPQ